MRIGSRKATPIDVRLIAATNVNLEEAVHAGRFREDLYYRIKVVPIDLPPLRERPGDILPLVEHFLNVYKTRLHTDIPKLADATIQQLLEYPWPGNIRELENVIHRALLISTSGILHPRDLGLPPIKASLPEKHDTSEVLASHIHKADSQQISSQAPANLETYQLERILNQLFESPPPNLFELVNAVLVEKAYEFSHKNQVHTAKLLGISRNILRARLKELKLIT